MQAGASPTAADLRESENPESGRAHPGTRRPREAAGEDLRGGPQAGQGRSPGPREAGEHLVHARIDEEETRVAAGPHGGRGQAAVAVALLEELKEGGANLPRRRAAGTPAAGAAAPRHSQQQPPPQRAGRRHGGPGQRAARRLPEGAGRGWWW